jgi:hypothetical protein
VTCFRNLERFWVLAIGLRNSASHEVSQQSTPTANYTQRKFCSKWMQMKMNYENYSSNLSFKTIKWKLQY